MVLVVMEAMMMMMMVVVMKLLIRRLGLADDVAGCAHLCAVCCWSVGSSMMLLRLMMTMTVSTTIVKERHLGRCETSCQSALDNPVSNKA